MVHEGTTLVPLGGFLDGINEGYAKLKQMLDKQLISQEDYDKVKNEILKKMIG